MSASWIRIREAARIVYSRSSFSSYLTNNWLSSTSASPATRAIIYWASVVRAADLALVLVLALVLALALALVAEPANTAPISTHWPSFTITLTPAGSEYSSWNVSDLITLITFPSSFWTTSATPSISDIIAWALGVLASKSSSTLGRPLVISSPTTPPVWKVRNVNWVPGSPMLWAAIIPTAVLGAIICPRPRSLP